MEPIYIINKLDDYMQEKQLSYSNFTVVDKDNLINQIVCVDNKIIILFQLSLHSHDPYYFDYIDTIDEIQHITIYTIDQSFSNSINMIDKQNLFLFFYGTNNDQIFYDKSLYNRLFDNTLFDVNSFDIKSFDIKSLHSQMNTHIKLYMEMSNIDNSIENYKELINEIECLI